MGRTTVGTATIIGNGVTGLIRQACKGEKRREEGSLRECGSRPFPLSAPSGLPCTCALEALARVALACAAQRTRHTRLAKARSGGCPDPTGLGVDGPNMWLFTQWQFTVRGFCIEQAVLPRAAACISCRCALFGRAPLDVDRELVTLELLPGANVFD